MTPTPPRVPRPEVGAPVRWAFPRSRSWSLDNGAQVVFFPLPGQHVVSTRIAIDAPLRAEPHGLEGVATLVSRTMDEGTARRSADEMAQQLELGGIGLSAGMVSAGMLVDLDATAPHLHRAWELAAEFLGSPAFDAGEVHRHQRQRLAEIEQERADPGARSAIQWASGFYTQDSRAARPSAGSAETVGRIDRDDCAAFHAAAVRPERACVIVAGDVPERQVRDRLAATLGDWQAPPAPWPLQPAPPDRVGRDVQEVVIVDRPGAVQTQVLLGSAGPDRRVDGGWAPYPALSFVIGGSPNSRIDTVLREQRGFTYGMHAGFRPRPTGGIFSVGGSVRGDATAPALELLHEILDDVRNGFSDNEVRAAVDYIGKTAPARYATADMVAGEAAALRLDGLGTDFVTGYLAQLRTLTAQDLSAAWARWCDQPRHLVLVGDADAHADQVARLGFGPVRVIPAD